jgi:hypothetical protein
MHTKTIVLITSGSTKKHHPSSICPEKNFIAYFCLNEQARYCAYFIDNEESNSGLTVKEKLQT